MSSTQDDHEPLNKQKENLLPRKNKETSDTNDDVTPNKVQKTSDSSPIDETVDQLSSNNPKPSDSSNLTSSSPSTTSQPTSTTDPLPGWNLIVLRNLPVNTNSNVASNPSLVTSSTTPNSTNPDSSKLPSSTAVSVTSTNASDSATLISVQSTPANPSSSSQVSSLSSEAIAKSGEPLIPSSAPPSTILSVVPLDLNDDTESASTAVDRHNTMQTIDTNLGSLNELAVQLFEESSPMVTDTATSTSQDKMQPKVILPSHRSASAITQLPATATTPIQQSTKVAEKSTSQVSMTTSEKPKPTITAISDSTPAPPAKAVPPALPLSKPTATPVQPTPLASGPSTIPPQAATTKPAVKLPQSTYVDKPGVIKIAPSKPKQKKKTNNKKKDNQNTALKTPKKTASVPTPSASKPEINKPPKNYPVAPTFVQDLECYNTIVAFMDEELQSQLEIPAPKKHEDTIKRMQMQAARFDLECELRGSMFRYLVISKKPTPIPAAKPSSTLTPSPNQLKITPTSISSTTQAAVVPHPQITKDAATANKPQSNTVTNIVQHRPEEKVQPSSPAVIATNKNNATISTPLPKPTDTPQPIAPISVTPKDSATSGKEKTPHTTSPTKDKMQDDQTIPSSKPGQQSSPNTCSSSNTPRIVKENTQPETTPMEIGMMIQEFFSEVVGMNLCSADDVADSPSQESNPSQDNHTTDKPVTTENRTAEVLQVKNHEQKNSTSESQKLPSSNLWTLENQDNPMVMFRELTANLEMLKEVDWTTFHQSDANIGETFKMIGLIKLAKARLKVQVRGALE